MTILTASTAQTTDSATPSPGNDGGIAQSLCSDEFISRLSDGERETLVQQRQEVIAWLIENGFPALPTAPKQDYVKYPKKNRKGEIEYEKDGVTPKGLFTGKNPSYLDEKGIPHLVFHADYQTKLPIQAEINKWFANSLNGIGTLGGWNNTVWLDFDIKNFDSESECEDAAMNCIDKITELSSEPFIERTHSGGWRIGVVVKEAPNFTNFCIERNGKHVGEALYKGRFTVLAPTIGVSGNPYENINRVKLPVVQNLEAIEIFPISSKKEDNPILRTVEVNYNSTEKTIGSVDLKEICSAKSKEVLAGHNTHNDRSQSLTMAIKELYGWMNWCSDNNVPVYGSVEALTFQAGHLLGLDDDRISRIIESIGNPSSYECAVFSKGGDKDCWKVIKKHSSESFYKLCSAEMKEIVIQENQEYAKKENRLKSDKTDKKELVTPENKINRETQSSQQVSNNLFGNAASKSTQYNSRKTTGKEIKSFCQQMYTELFEDENYIYVFKQFYQWVGTHYEPIHSAVITKQVHDYCDTYKAFKEDKDTGEKITYYPFASPDHVNKAVKWITQKFGIDPKLINPPGLNCIDGVLQLSYDPDSQSLIKTLVPHDHCFYYLYEPKATYQISPIVLPDACDQLLSCLDAPERDIFLKTIGAAFDLETVRRYRGREVKALLLHGYGNNGKDALRKATSMLFGDVGMVNVSLTDFKIYDEGRKFPLYKLEGARANWPSENADGMLLDQIQSLKIAITGDPLSAERKGMDEYLFHPKAVHLFNVNSLPRLSGGMEAILSRFAILKFHKTYKPHPKAGELQADSRFLYNPDFVRTDVLPWYLHYCLEALERLMREGINYDVTETAWEELRGETDHFYTFCNDAGIGYKANGVLGAGEVYEALREWYLTNGSLEIVSFGETTKDVWSPDPAWADHLVKAKNQVFPRLLKLFPEAKRERDSSGRSILIGVGWRKIQPDDEKNVSLSYISEAPLKLSEAPLKQLQPIQCKHSEAPEAVSPKISEIKNSTKEKQCNCGGQCPVCVVEAAKNLADKMVCCNTGAELQALLKEHAHLSEAAWRLIPDDDSDYVTGLLTEWEIQQYAPEVEPQNSKKEVNSPHLLQVLQNPDFVRDEAASEVLQTASEVLQNCIDTIPNNPIDFSDLIAQTGAEITRLGWSTQQGKAYLLETYGKRSRQLLTDEELLDFLNYLQAQPTPQPEKSDSDSETSLEQLNLIPSFPTNKEMPSVSHQASKVGKRVRIETPETHLHTCGEGIIEVDRGNGCIEVRMLSGERAGGYQILSKGYVILDDE